MRAESSGRLLLDVRGVSKWFGRARALTDISVSVHAGEILAVVGHNGSGKSTLVKILAGFHAADSGEVALSQEDGRTATMRFIHQDLGLVDALSAVENLSLVRTSSGRWWHRIDHQAEADHAAASIARFGARFDVEKPVGDLSPAQKTIVAIARALDNWSPDEDVVLVLDEPTAALQGAETEGLMNAVREVARHGAGVLFISHRLDEVLGLADTVLALRDGQVIANGPCASFDYAALVELIAGSAVEAHVKVGQEAGSVVLQARGLVGPSLRELDLDLRAGEIVGVAGQLGSGRDELCATLFGVQPRVGGQVLLRGRELAAGRVRDSIAAGIAFIPGDRRRRGAVMEMTATENLMSVLTPRLRERWRPVDSTLEREQVSKWFELCDVKPRTADLPLSGFSGGNQQKVVIAKWLRRDPQILLLDDPTQGVDVGAKAAIHGLVADAARRGAAVLVASSEERELADLCDRVLVLVGGRVAAELSGSDLTEAQILHAALPSPTHPNVERSSSR